MELRSVIKTILEIYFLLQITTISQTSRVTNAKHQIRNLIGDELAEARRDVRRIRHTSGVDNPRRWSSRRKLGAPFSLWSTWSKCDMSCIRRRERFCKVKRVCGFTKQIEEQMCKNCIFHPSLTVNAPLNHLQQYLPQSKNSNSNNNYEKNHVPIPIPVYQEIEESNKHEEETNDFYVITKRNKKKYRKKKKPIVVEIEDYEDLEDDDNDYVGDIFGLKLNKNQIRAIRSKNLLGEIDYGKRYQNHRIRLKSRKKKNLYQNVDELEYNDDTADFLENRNDYVDVPYEYDERYENIQHKNMSKSPLPREKAVVELPRYRRVYSKWSKWTKCSSKCTTRRYKKCRMKEICGKEVLREIAYCYTEGSFCQQWLQTQIQKNTPYDVKPIISDRKDVINTNAVVNDYIISEKGYRGSEYTPMKLKCGIPSIRKSLSNMLKIIGGKVSRKGEWPWQAVIFNRYKEAFCGGTLIAPQWVLTAAHCVRKVLYVRLGEHNLDVDDGTEVEFRVTRSFKHPNYDKATVDSDIALLKLPKPVNVSTWIGFSCLPQPFQPLPRNVLCTVIGWGKRRNRDQSGTSVLHQAEVPIISMDHCKKVYFDYTITKNMFCAGHKRGRIDTCAGDSGGPLLCRDTTKPNNPWTIFGITSFGDGCAKKNKFGIYAKVPNYVDWIWSVINCNGNCKSRKRT